MKKKVIIISLFISLLVIGIYSYYSFSDEFVALSSSSSNMQNSVVTVQIKGEVNRPGVYVLEKGARYEDLVLVAGGFSRFADVKNINLVKVLSDSECVEVGRNDISSIKTLVNLNEAKEKDLEVLSGIGKTKALAIIAYRDSHGSFKRKEDILNVPGITYAIYEQIYSQITIS